MRYVKQGKPRREPGLAGAFTIVELLVVITIISILCAILMPALRQVMEVARSSSCSSNMRQVGQLSRDYALSYEHYMLPVPRGEATKYKHWDMLLCEMLGDKAFYDIIDCPSHRTPEMDPQYHPRDYCLIGYAGPANGNFYWKEYNDILETKVQVWPAGNPYNRVRASSTTILHAEMNTEYISSYLGEAWRKHTPRIDFDDLSTSWHFTWQTGFAKFGWYYPDNPLDSFGDYAGIHLKKTNFIYCDGHVGTKGLADIKAGDFTVDPAD